jgi:hypothetical protein
MENNKKKIVIIDIGNPALDNNRVFSPAEAMKISHTILPICYLGERLAACGYTVLTPDLYLAMTHQQSAVLVSFLTNQRTKQILKAGAAPSILICLESPFIASKFYVLLRFISSRFRHVMLFDGMKRMVSRKTDFMPVRFPQAFDSHESKPRAFSEKKLVTMICSNKSVNNIFKDIVLRFCYGPEVKEIYAERLKVIEHFSEDGAFDLFGFGWDRGVANAAIGPAVARCYRGPVASKAETMRNYKFAFCFENTIFPGYVTEKIFDALMNGTVPIYLGAPDIADFVDQEAFIDFRKYDDLERLHEYLKTMTEDEYQKLLDAGSLYLQTEKFKEFTQERFAERIISLLESEG